MAEYLGSQKVSQVLRTEGDTSVRVMLEDGQGLEMNANLYDLAKSDKKNEGTPQDAVLHRVALKLFETLSEYGFTVIEVVEVCSRLGNVVHNFREEAVGRKFGVKSSQLIKLSDLIE
jgi:hypothetical protein